MAIINLEAKGGKVYSAEGDYTPWYPDAAEAHSYAYNGGAMSESNHVTISLSHVGLCLFDYERNGYDDSDWYMAVWNPEKGCREDILFATTRGWSYPCYGSKPDATPEVQAAHEAWKAQRAAEAQAQREAEAARKAAEQAAADAALAAEIGCAVERVAALRDAMGDQYPACVTLLRTRNFRSAFRKSCADQIRTWLLDPAPKYASPLSYKQRQYI
ncbi:hypothetical protein BcepSauron_016 [Burkholderia phage BcepSauron]|uniref:Uncharacterized protein n=1 Tax=Burkholderia phage BcepSauron TaxID=2530033 RepID=A0A482MLN0_9CAUD|nr:hypothetical protein H1O17_gp016 [Burkholderia phage BcepSauron]QBQ74396.1 hypothetical protein BcepSauron_016 [Burkholderia phage BcepSauron]